MTGKSGRSWDSELGGPDPAGREDVLSENDKGTEDELTPAQAKIKEMAAVREPDYWRTGGPGSPGEPGAGDGKDPQVSQDYLDANAGQPAVIRKPWYKRFWHWYWVRNNSGRSAI